MSGTVLGDGTLNQQGGPMEVRVSVADVAQPTDVVIPVDRRTTIEQHFNGFKEAVRPRRNWMDTSVRVATEEGIWERTWQKLSDGTERLTYERVIDHGKETYMLTLPLGADTHVAQGYYFGLSPDVGDYKPNTRGLLQRIDEIVAIIKAAEQAPTGLSTQSVPTDTSPGHRMGI